MIAKHELPNTGKTVEWGTPKFILEALGPFDFDGTDFLFKPWPKEGFVFLNPPYGKSIGIWLQKIAVHNDGIALVFARTDTVWWHEFVGRHASAVLFLRGRLSFVPLLNQHVSSNAGAPSALVGYGERALERLDNSKLSGWLVHSLTTRCI